MKKNTENNRHISKAIYGCAVGLAFQLAFQLPSSIGAQMILVFIVILAYVLPFIINVEYIKSHEIAGVKPFIKEDIVFLFPEAVVTCAVAEFVITSFMENAAYFSGMGLLIFFGVASLTMLCFWAAYAVVNKLYKDE